MIDRATARELRMSIRAGFLVLLGILLPVVYVAAAIGPGMWGMLAGVPVALVGLVLVLVGERLRVASQGPKIWASILGGLLVVGSIWAAFMTNNAIFA